jgi:branched-subunit amino acid ABC-type transport system permease component
VRAGNIYFIVAHLCLCYLLPLFLITICYALILRRVSHRHIPQETKNLSTELLVQRFGVSLILSSFELWNGITLTLTEYDFRR